MQPQESIAKIIACHDISFTLFWIPPNFNESWHTDVATGQPVSPHPPLPSHCFMKHIVLCTNYTMAENAEFVLVRKAVVADMCHK